LSFRNIKTLTFVLFGILIKLKAFHVFIFELPILHLDIFSEQYRSQEFYILNHNLKCAKDFYRENKKEYYTSFAYALLYVIWRHPVQKSTQSIILIWIGWSHIKYRWAYANEVKYFILLLNDSFHEIYCYVSHKLLHIDQKSRFVFNLIINFIHTVCEILKIRVFCLVTIYASSHITFLSLTNQSGNLYLARKAMFYLLNIDPVLSIPIGWKVLIFNRMLILYLYFCYKNDF
jgi:hypothetical protein